jgi:hypothetical protein
MIVATKNSVLRFDPDSDGHEPNPVFKGGGVRRVIEGENTLVVTLDRNNLIVIQGSDERHVRTGITDRIDSLCLVQENPLSLLIGTTPPFLYEMRETGPARRIPSFDELDVRHRWYTPWGGPAAVRSLAKTRDGRVYADIHVGSIMRSPDTGQTWEPVTPTLHEDVHEVTTTPASKQRVYANTYRSVYISDDRGDTWDHRSTNLNNRYGRGIAVHPDDPDLLLCGVSDGPTGANVRGQLYRTTDAGENWTHVTDGFPPSTRTNIDTFHLAFTKPDTAWATDDTVLYRSQNRGKTWEAYWTASEAILMISSKSY